MIVIHPLLLVFGIVAGLLIASSLRRLRWEYAARLRALIAFGGGTAAWIGFALIALSGPFVWTFIGTVLAIYLPTLIVIGLSGGSAVVPGRPA